MSNALQDVIAERARQREKGYTEEHDDDHEPWEFAQAASAYALTHMEGVPPLWPWEESAWKPRDERSNLVRAAALLIAAVELHDRLKARAGK